jgi:hypothetical protein
LDGGSLYWSSSLVGVVLSVLRGVGMAFDGAKGTAIPLGLAESVWCACSCQSSALGIAQSLPIPPRGQDGGEVMRSYAACGEGSEKGSWPTPALVFGPGPHSLAGP